MSASSPLHERVAAASKDAERTAHSVAVEPALREALAKKIAAQRADVDALAQELEDANVPEEPYMQMDFLISEARLDLAYAVEENEAISLRLGSFLSFVKSRRARRS